MTDRTTGPKGAGAGGDPAGRPVFVGLDDSVRPMLTGGTKPAPDLSVRL